MRTLAVHVNLRQLCGGIVVVNGHTSGITDIAVASNTLITSFSGISKQNGIINLRVHMSYFHLNQRGWFCHVNAGKPSKLWKIIGKLYIKIWVPFSWIKTCHSQNRSRCITEFWLGQSVHINRPLIRGDKHPKTVTIPRTLDAVNTVVSWTFQPLASLVW